MLEPPARSVSEERTTSRTATWGREVDLELHRGPNLDLLEAEAAVPDELVSGAARVLRAQVLVPELDIHHGRVAVLAPLHVVEDQLFPVEVGVRGSGKHVLHGRLLRLLPRIPLLQAFLLRLIS